MRNAPPLLLSLLLLVAAPWAQAMDATVTRAWQFKPDAAAGLVLDNLVGDLSIEPAAAGEGFHVTASVVVDADSAAEAERLARAVDFRSSDIGPGSTFQVLLPEKEFPVIYYPGVARGSFFSRTYVNHLGVRRQLTGDPDRGVQVRVNLRVRVPADAQFRINNRLGNVVAAGVAGQLEIDSSRGTVHVRNGRGRLAVDTGAGAVEIATHEGDVSVDTGSGAVRISDTRGRIVADTGSGLVRVSGGAGEVDADTGSGAVVVDSFAGSVRADTGSGAVTIMGLREVRELVVDTGSGSVRIGGDLSALEQLNVDTGSGAVTVEATALPAMQIALSTGSGRIEADVPDGDLQASGRRDAVLRIGAATHRGLIDTGSGSIRISMLPEPQP